MTASMILINYFGLNLHRAIYCVMQAKNMMIFYQKSLTSKFYLPNHRVVYVKANKLIIEKKLKQKNLIYKYTVAVLL